MQRTVPLFLRERLSFPRPLAPVSLEFAGETGVERAGGTPDAEKMERRLAISPSPEPNCGLSHAALE